MDPKPFKYLPPTQSEADLAFEPEPVTIYGLPQGGDSAPSGPATRSERNMSTPGEVSVELDGLRVSVEASSQNGSIREQMKVSGEFQGRFNVSFPTEDGSVTSTSVVKQGEPGTETDILYDPYFVSEMMGLAVDFEIHAPQGFFRGSVWMEGYMTYLSLRRD